MREEVTKYFNDRHLELYKLVNRGAKYNLPEHIIIDAMIHCYGKIMSGKEIPDIELARYVFNVAKEIIGGKFESTEDYITRLKRKILILTITTVVFIGINIVLIILWGIE